MSDARYKELMKTVQKEYGGDVWEYYRRHRQNDEYEDNKLQGDLLRAKETIPVIELENQIQLLTKKLEVAVKGLEFYADKNNRDKFKESDVEHIWGVGWVGGKTARAALKELEEMK